MLQHPSPSSLIRVRRLRQARLASRSDPPAPPPASGGSDDSECDPAAASAAAAEAAAILAQLRRAVRPL